MNLISRRASHLHDLPTALLHGKVIDKAIIDLSIGFSNQEPPQIAKQAAIQAIRKNKVPYEAVAGSARLRETIAKKIKRENHYTSSPEQIIVTNGAKQAIYEALFVLTNPGDRVLIFRPYWPAYENACYLLNLKPIFVSLENPPNVLPRAKILLLNNPHNPTGKVFSRTELVWILKQATKNKMTIIADESYEKLVYQGKHISIASLNKEIPIISVYSASQSFSMMGWRIGYACGPVHVIQAMEAVQGPITASPNAVSQAALIAVLHSGSRHHAKQLKVFRKNRDLAYSKLTVNTDLKLKKPKAGPYLWINVHKHVNNVEGLQQYLLENKKVAVIAGENFGVSEYIRISFTSVSTKELLKAIDLTFSGIKEFAAKGKIR